MADALTARFLGRTLPKRVAKAWSIYKQLGGIKRPSTRAV
jgi:hypothetical protein